MQSHCHTSNRVEVQLDQAFLRVNMFGHVFSEELENELEGSLEEFPNKIVHGEWSSAAGPALTLELILSIANQLPAEIVGGMAMLAIEKTFSFLKVKLGSNEARYDLGSLVVQSKTYDVVIFGALNKLPIEEMLLRVDEFVISERNEGRLVSKIKLPCSLNREMEYESNKWISSPNYSLWLIQYKSSAVHENAVYDEINESLILNPKIARNSLSEES